MPYVDNNDELLMQSLIDS